MVSLVCPDMNYKKNYSNHFMSIILLLSFIVPSIASQLQQCYDINDETECTDNSDCEWVQFDNPPQKCDENIASSDCYCADYQLISSRVSCLYDYQDIIFLVDASCPITVEQCKQQQLDIADTMSHLRGIAREKIDSSDDNPYATIRIGYIEYGESVNIKINLDDSPENMNMTDFWQSRFMIYETIENSSICNGDTMQRNPLNSTLQTAIGSAINMFKTQQTKSLGHDGKILIFSNCGLTQEQEQNVCDEYENMLIQQNNDRYGYNIFMVNNNPDNDTMSNPEEYIKCLVEFDPNRIITIKQSDNFTANIPLIKQQVCDTPTQSPTPVPIPPPTRSPITAAPSQLPTTSQPTTAIPTFVPTTADPTTDHPTTAEPTTAEPTTAEPTTAEPTTDVPTTGNPTTANPTTDYPTTDNPTTAEPTTFEPTTASPSTGQPTATIQTTTTQKTEIIESSSLKTTQTTEQLTTLFEITSNEDEEENDTENIVVTTFVTEDELGGYDDEFDDVKPKSSKLEEGMTVLWISLGIIGSCCVFGIIFLFIRRKKYQSQTSYDSIDQGGLSEVESSLSENDR